MVSNKIILKLLTVLIVSLPLLNGCTKPYWPIDNYEAKQIQYYNLDAPSNASYVFCKNCLEYTKLSEVEN